MPEKTMQPIQEAVQRVRNVGVSYEDRNVGTPGPVQSPFHSIFFPTRQNSHGGIDHSQWSW